MRELGPDSIEMREYLFSLVDWSTVRSVLDIGCSDGFDLGQISKLVSASGCSFVGLDSSEEKIETARSHFKTDPRFSFDVADVEMPLKFSDDYFDLIICMNMLECVQNQETLMTEMHRILAPQGQVLFTHFDWDSQLINATNKSLVRKMVHAFCDWKQPWMTECDGWMGRRLYAAIGRTGLFEGRLKPYVLVNTKFEAPYYGFRRIEDFGGMVERGLVDRADYDELLGDVKAIAEQEQYFYSITNFVYVGKKL